MELIEYNYYYSLNYNIFSIYFKYFECTFILESKYNIESFSYCIFIHFLLSFITIKKINQIQGRILYYESY